MTKEKTRAPPHLSFVTRDWTVPPAVPLIKKNQAESAVQSAVVLDLGDLRREAERIRAEAGRQARAMIEAGRRKAAQLTEGAEERGYEAGRQRGYDDGYKAGVEQGKHEARAEAREQLADFARCWQEALADFEARRGDMLADAREDVLRLALRLSERIVQAAVAVTPDCAAQQAIKALELVTEASRVRLLVHPDDQDRLREVLPELEKRAQASEHIVLQPSRDVPRGGVVLSHGKGVIDATVETQLERLVAQLFPDAKEETPPLLETDATEATDTGSGVGAPDAEPAEGADPADDTAPSPDGEPRDEASSS